MHTLTFLQQALAKRTPSGGTDNQSIVSLPLNTGEVDETHDEIEGSPDNRLSSSCVQGGSSGTVPCVSFGGEGVLEDSGGLTHKSVEVLAKQLEVGASCNLPLSCSPHEYNLSDK